MSGMVRILALNFVTSGGNGGPLHNTTPVLIAISSPLRPDRSLSVNTHALSPALTILRGAPESSSMIDLTVALPVHVVRPTPRCALTEPCTTAARTTTAFSFSVNIPVIGLGGRIEKVSSFHFSAQVLANIPQPPSIPVSRVLVRSATDPSGWSAGLW